MLSETQVREDIASMREWCNAKINVVVGLLREGNVETASEVLREVVDARSGIYFLQTVLEEDSDE